MKAEIPPPDQRLNGKVTVLSFPTQRDVLTLASNVPPENAEPKQDGEEEIRRLAKPDPRDRELERKPAGVGGMNGVINAEFSPERPLPLVRPIPEPTPQPALI